MQTRLKNLYHGSESCSQAQIARMDFMDRLETVPLVLTMRDHYLEAQLYPTVFVWRGSPRIIMLLASGAVSVRINPKMDPLHVCHAEVELSLLQMRRHLV